MILFFVFLIYYFYFTHTFNNNVLFSNPKIYALETITKSWHKTNEALVKIQIPNADRQFRSEKLSRFSRSKMAGVYTADVSRRLVEIRREGCWVPGTSPPAAWYHIVNHTEELLRRFCGQLIKIFAWEFINWYNADRRYKVI